MSQQQQDKITSNVLSFLAFVLALSVAATTVACNTVKGVGRDVESVGEAGSDAIDDLDD